MPLYEYLCRKCSRRFEALVMGKTAATCPGCGDRDLEKLVSTFSLGPGLERSSGASELSRDPGSACGTCGDPRGPGSCLTDEA